MAKSGPPLQAKRFGQPKQMAHGNNCLWAETSYTFTLVTAEIIR